MNLKQLLMDLGNDLIAGGFDPAAVAKEQILLVVKNHLEDTFVIALFTEWLNRCPEAQAYLAANGVAWPVYEQQVGRGQRSGPVEERLGEKPDAKAWFTLGQVPSMDLTRGPEGQTYSAVPAAMSSADMVRSLSNGEMRSGYLTGVIDSMIRMEGGGVAWVVTRDKIHPDDLEKADALIEKYRRLGQESTEARMRRPK